MELNPPRIFLEHLTEFTTFGKNLVQTNSFIMISNQFLHDEFLVVPTQFRLLF